MFKWNSTINMNINYLIIGMATINVLSCYVLLQVRKGDNQSNVDALIHKVVPARNFDKIADTARKHFKQYKQYKIKNKSGDKELESIVFAIKTDEDGNGGKQDGRPESRNRKVVDLLTDIKRTVMDFITPKAGHANFRAKMEKYNIKPELIRLRSGDGKPSVMYEIETTSVIKSLTDALRSKQVRRYSDNVARTAAYVYRLIKEA